jgi:hypothetical protein
MRAKIGVVIVGTALAIFAIGRVGNLKAGHRFTGSQAWAQDSEDRDDNAAVQQGDASDQDGVVSPNNDAPQDQASAPDSADDELQNQLGASSLKFCIKHPFPATGLWSGTVMDNNLGGGTFMASLFQCQSKLSGTWDDTFVPPAFWKGTISSSDNIKALLRFHISGKCGYTFTGTLKNDNEIFGNYTLQNCKGMGPDGGSFDIFKVPPP